MCPLNNSAATLKNKNCHLAQQCAKVSPAETHSWSLHVQIWNLPNGIGAFAKAAVRLNEMQIFMRAYPGL